MRDTIFRLISAILQKTAGLLLFAMFITITIQIGARNFLHTSVSWSEEISRMLLIWMTFLGAPAVLYKGEHLMVDLIYAGVSSRARKYINILANIVIIAFCIFGLKLGYGLCTNRIILRSVTAAASIPRVYIFSALPVGSILMMIFAFNSLYSNVLVLTGKAEDKDTILIVDETRTLDEIEGADD
ncbi:MAG: TRAP transporter small permease [Synergistaceae bacterium]|nr:TRAP transporter small permease [Synergistaceae bacterium]